MTSRQYSDNLPFLGSGSLLWILPSEYFSVDSKQHLFNQIKTLGRGAPGKVGWGCAARFPKPLPFMTKICDIPYPIYDLTKYSIPYL